MYGVSFDNYHSFRDLRIVLTEKEIGAPDVKKNTLDIPGGDGELDLTEVFGEPKFGNVTHKFTFVSIQNDLLTQYSVVKGALHGKKMKIILDADPDYYYIGRCEVSSMKDEHGVGTIIVTCDCEPYKYALAKTVVYQKIEGVVDVKLLNSRRRAVPEVWIETEGSMNIVFGTSNIWDLASGTYTLPELELVEGENIVTVTGTGAVAFTWQEAAL